MIFNIVPSLWLQGTWVWLADHDLDLVGEQQITVYSGRGILSESQGPVWMIGTACALITPFRSQKKMLSDFKIISGT